MSQKLDYSIMTFMTLMKAIALAGFLDFVLHDSDEGHF
ncbi:hypothetical protein BAOM_4791 [Peribacillus asahii]|uniref:Uncharacterized protein n=1 Tax=Peribacillus asahii TaxID=228899 RepID=A0A3Q9RQU5_9BACI|nr:hypothetical protein BAOM_4791 [Peribacillus asahii]